MLGASSGIGEAVALLFADEGAEVVVVGRGAARVAGVVEGIGSAARGLPGDAGSPIELRGIFKDAGALDHVVLAASGGGGGGPFADLDLTALEAAFAAKFWLHLRALRAALPSLRGDARSRSSRPAQRELRSPAPLGWRQSTERSKP